MGFKSITQMAQEWTYGRTTVRDNLRKLLDEKPEYITGGHVERKGGRGAYWADETVQKALHERLENNGVRVVTIEEANWRAQIEQKEAEIKDLLQRLASAQSNIITLQNQLGEQKQLQQQLQLTAETAEHEAQRALDEKQRALDEKQQALEIEQARRLTWRERLTGHKDALKASREEVNNGTV